MQFNSFYPTEIQIICAIYFIYFLPYIIYYIFTIYIIWYTTILCQLRRLPISYFLQTNQNFQTIKKEGNIESKYVITFSRRSVSVANMQKAVNISNLISANVGEFYTWQCFRYVSHSKLFTGKYRIVWNWSSKFATCFHFIRRIRNNTYEITSALSFDRKHQVVLTH